MPAGNDNIKGPVPPITDFIGGLPYRMAFAGGWIDQPFLSKLNPAPPGSMVVVSIEPTCRFMDRCGVGTSTRKVAARLWGDHIPAADPSQRVRELYQVENKGKNEPSGSQDMAGLVYPGISRLDYDFSYEAGYFPVHVETCCDTEIAHWLEGILYMLPVCQRPDGYSPLGIKNLEPEWIRRLGKSGKACYDAILASDVHALGASMNECMVCWEALLPHTVRHPAIQIDLIALLKYYQARYAGAMYSGCGGGYLYVVSKETVPGGFQVKVRI
jgi:hypothetical protein